MNRAEQIRSLLDKALCPSRVHIEDESHKHAGHAGAAGGAGHFRVEIVSAAFAGKAPLARHRLVYAALAEMMPAAIHALSIEARTAEEIRD